mmetsp:Transcript_14970/g.26495  ORF Transcript_14970/g.26495 Transcript_14970/m.26495 type:complete len:119 (+) Transcript_14970:114-470(+)
MPSLLPRLPTAMTFAISCSSHPRPAHTEPSLVAWPRRGRGSNEKTTATAYTKQPRRLRNSSIHGSNPMIVGCGSHAIFIAWSIYSLIFFRCSYFSDFGAYDYNSEAASASAAEGKGGG